MFLFKINNTSARCDGGYTTKYSHENDGCKPVPVTIKSSNLFYFNFGSVCKINNLNLLVFKYINIVV